MFRIAVCDDEKIFVERISEIVKAFFKEQKLECQVDEFYSGEEFVELKEEVGKYDIVFLDMQMDKMNGIETAKYLRKYLFSVCYGLCRICCDRLSGAGNLVCDKGL